MQIQTKAQDKKDAVAKLYDIRETLRELQKEEERLKSEVKSFMKENILVAGEYVVSIVENKRTDWDKEKLFIYLGDQVDAFKKTTTYQTMSVKRVKQ